MEVMHSGFAFLTAMLVCLGAVPLIIRFAVAQGLYDLPDVLSFLSTPKANTISRRIHNAPVPLLGGIAIFLSFLATYLVWSLNSRLGAIVGSSVLIFMVGLIDDIRTLPARFRLLSQTACTKGVALQFKDLLMRLLDILCQP